MQIRGKAGFDLDSFLKKPLFAHLATGSDEGPRDSPVWYLWEENKLWIIGTEFDSFPRRLEREPRCAVGIVDFDPHSGRVHHAGFRGSAVVQPFDPERACRLLSRYLGPNPQHWDPRFRGLEHPSVLIRFTPETVVVRDQTYYRAPVE